MVRFQNMRPSAFKLTPWDFFQKLIILSQINKNNFFEKFILELCRTAMIKPRQIEHSGFFLLDHNGQTQIYRLVSGKPDERLWWKRTNAIAKVKIQGTWTFIDTKMDPVRLILGDPW